MKVSAVFDIGKTNKKFFLFNKNFQQVYKKYARFDSITDDDGDECEDLSTLVIWMQDVLQKVNKNKKFRIISLNNSSYGASLVHIGADGKPVTPLYNYLKPAPASMLKSFYEKYGSADNLGKATASPALGFLNSGLQLYWLKHCKPHLFEKITWSLHLPQYLSYLFTGNPVSEFTSLGCHTGLWNFEENDYHQWVYQEGINKVLPPIVNTDASVTRNIYGKTMEVGVGIHDSSAALLPYIKADQNPFLLVSTGTWSISLNAFSTDSLIAEDLAHDCLNYMRINGLPVRSCRLFLGREYRTQVKHLHDFYNKTYGYHRDVKFDKDIYTKLKGNFQPNFRFEHIEIQREQPAMINLEQFATFEEALHQLVLELVFMQAQCITRAIGSTQIRKLYIDGGFANNDLYVQMLVDQFPNLKIRITKSPLGSALGASMVTSKLDLKKKFLKNQYAMKKVKFISN